MLSAEKAALLEKYDHKGSITLDWRDVCGDVKSILDALPLSRANILIQEKYAIGAGGGFSPPVDATEIVDLINRIIPSDLPVDPPADPTTPPVNPSESGSNPQEPA